jgi:hypothetical protein
MERGAQGVRSARLLQRNQRAPVNVVVDGGRERDRIAAVRALHRASVLRDRAFCVAHGVRDHDRLHRSLMHWLGLADGPAPLECEGGMLYVDDPGALSAFVQRMLIDQGERARSGLAADPAAGPGPGPARLAAGNGCDLGEDVARGRLLPALHDMLDKFHLEIGLRRRERSRSR